MIVHLVSDSPIRVIVVDDVPAFRLALEWVVDATDGFVLVGRCADGQAALAMLDERAVDLLLMDVVMPGISGVRTAELVRAAHPGVIVVLLSAYDEGQLPEGISTCGAPFRHKDQFGPDELEAVWALVTGSGP